LSASLSPPGKSRQLRAALRHLLQSLDPALEPFVEDVLGASSRIPLVARDRAGRAWAILHAAEGEDRARLTDVLAQAAWLTRRLADWQKLAPELGLRPELGVGAVLVCARFHPHTEQAAGALGAERILLLHLSPLPEGIPTRPPAGKAAPPAPRAVFRTGLRDEDMAEPRRRARTPAHPRGEGGKTFFGTR